MVFKWQHVFWNCSSSMSFLCNVRRINFNRGTTRRICTGASLEACDDLRFLDPNHLSSYADIWRTSGLQRNQDFFWNKGVAALHETVYYMSNKFKRSLWTDMHMQLQHCTPVEAGFVNSCKSGWNTAVGWKPWTETVAKSVSLLEISLFWAELGEKSLLNLSANDNDMGHEHALSSQLQSSSSSL